MQPIFPEYIKFLNSQGCNTDWFQERTFWLDRNMVKGFKRGGKNLLHCSESRLAMTYL